MIDRELNYGREIIVGYCSKVAMSAPRIVDIGAGIGADLFGVVQVCPGSQLCAIENFPAYAHVLRERCIEVVQANIERDIWPIEKRSVDIIIANQVFEHIKEVFWVLDQCASTLKVGGCLIIGVPNLASLHNRLLLCLGRQPSSMRNWSAHVRGYTYHDLVELLDRPFPNGFKVECLRGSNFYPFPPLLAKPLARMFPKLAWGIFVKFIKVREYSGEFLRYPAAERLETNFYVGDETRR